MPKEYSKTTDQQNGSGYAPSLANSVGPRVFAQKMADTTVTLWSSEAQGFRSRSLKGFFLCKSVKVTVSCPDLSEHYSPNARCNIC